MLTVYLCSIVMCVIICLMLLNKAKKIKYKLEKSFSFTEEDTLSKLKCAAATGMLIAFIPILNTMFVLVFSFISLALVCGHLFDKLMNSIDKYIEKD